MLLNHPSTVVVSVGLKWTLLQRTHASPFRYLGAPISTCKLKQSHCEALVEKMILRIKIWSSKNNDFAGRMQLVNFVLMSICVYCVLGSDLHFPQSCLTKINAICTFVGLFCGIAIMMTADLVLTSCYGTKLLWESWLGLLLQRKRTCG